MSFTVAVERLGPTGGREHYLITVTESSVAGASDEWTVTLGSQDLPRVGRVKALSCVSSGGSHTTIAPRAGMVTGGTDVYSISAASSPIFNNPTIGQVWPHAATLYGRSGANGTATTITTKILLAEGSV